MSASVMAGMAGVKAAVGAIAACCRLRAAAPEATARAAVVAAMNFIAMCCGCLHQSKQAVSPIAERPTINAHKGRRSRAARTTRLCSGSSRFQKMLSGPLHPAKTSQQGQAHLRDGGFLKAASVEGEVKCG